MKLLAIAGSHRIEGNCYAISKAVLDSLDCDYSIIQLANKEIMYCTICEECVTKDCVLTDDLYNMLKEMHESDGIIFVVPKYLSVPSKFMAFLERLASIVHMRKHNGYEGPPVNPDYTLFKEGKPFCIFALSGRGNYGEQHINTIVDYAEYLGMNLVSSDHASFIAVDVKAGDVKGEVLGNKEAIKQCRELAQKLVTLSRN